jgi:2'-5' RNA ligase
MRLFVAIELPEEEQQRLRATARRQDWFGFGEGWAGHSPHYHVTLKFLGAVSDERVPQVIDALKKVDWPRSLMLRGEGVTFFPPRGPINVFVGLLGGDVGPLKELHTRVEAALLPLGIAREDRPYVPHVTLKRAERRRRPVGVVRDLVAKNQPAPGPPFVTDSFVLFQSHLKPEGPEYIPLARFPA